MVKALLLCFYFPEMLQPTSTMFKSFETGILEHVRFLFCLHMITTQIVFSETYTVDHFCGFRVLILMVLMGLKQRLDFTRQLYIFPEHKEGIPKVPLSFLLQERQGQLSATPSLCKGTLLLGRGNALRALSHGSEWSCKRYRSRSSYVLSYRHLFQGLLFSSFIFALQWWDLLSYQLV